MFKFYQQQVFPKLLDQVMQLPSLMDKRRELLLAVQGDVLEIGFGTGVNLPFYQAVDHLYALEPNPSVFQLAQQRLEQAPFLVTHLAAGAESIPLADASVDHVVSTWTLCSVQSVAAVLAEIDRVLKPNGSLHVVEHVLFDAQHPHLQRLQHCLTPVQKVVADGCHLNRDIEAELIKAGFQAVQKQYFMAAGVPKIAKRMLLMRAVKRG